MTDDARLTETGPDGELIKVPDRRMPLRVGIVASVVAVGLAFLPACLGPAAYSPEVAVLTATLLALIWYTYFTFRGVQEAQRAPLTQARFQRRALAAALLPEVKRLETELSDRAETPRSGQPRSPLLKRALDLVWVFPPTTAKLMSELAAMLDELTHLYRVAEQLGESRQESTAIANERRRRATEKSKELLEHAVQAAQVASDLAGELRVLQELPGSRNRSGSGPSTPAKA